MMKVLLIQPQMRDFDAFLAKALKEAGIEAVFAYTEGRTEGHLFNGCEPVWLRVRSRLDVAGIISLRRLIREIDPDIVYCGTALQCFATIVAAVGYRPIKIVFYRGAIRSLNYFSPSDWLIFKSGRVSVFHCNSQAVANALRQVGIRDTQIAIFPGTGYFASQFEWGSVEGRVLLRSATYRIGAVANYRKVKGLEFLIEAARFLLERGMDIEVVIVGSDLKGCVGRFADRVGIRGRLICTGPITPPWPVMKTFDCLVVPSLKESLPKVIIEAFACQIPVVATRVGGIPEMLEFGEAGELVEPGNSEALAKAIQRVLCDPGKAAKYKDQGQRIFKKRYEAGVVATQYVALFNRLAWEGKAHAKQF
jgi:glycosyltransferase involved in cell wall biosynthesis